MKSLFQHKLFILLALIVIGAVAWYAFSSAGSAPSLTTSATAGGSGTSTADAQLVATLLQLRTVTLNSTIFSDPAFESLQDFSTQIVPEPSGRPDPFAPLPQNAQPSASTTKSAQIFTPHK